MINIPETVAIHANNTVIKKPKQFLFDPCGSLYNANQGGIVDVLRLKDLETCKYQITERLTGIDLAFWVFGYDEIRVSSNNGFVDGSFYNCERLVDRYRTSLIRIRDYHSAYTGSYHLPPVERPCVVVYGQIVGSILGNDHPYYGAALDFFAIELMTIQSGLCNFRRPVHGRDVLTKFGVKCVPSLAVTRCLSDALTYKHTGPRVTVFRSPSVVIRPYEVDVWLFETRRPLLTRLLDC